MIEKFRSRFLEAWEASDRIFDLVPRTAWLEQPILLRHPILFYIGHLPAFAWNQVGRGVLGLDHFHPEFDDLFERGIDPVGIDGHEATVQWPAVDEVLDYRDRVRRRLLDLLPEVAARAAMDRLAARGRILNVVLEHEYMHHETLQYMLTQLEPGSLRRPTETAEARPMKAAVSGMVEVAGGTVALGADFDGIEFGWDNEFPIHEVRVDGFRIDRTPVRVSEYLEFVSDGGYDRAELWQPEDWRWRQRQGVGHPVFWRRDDDGWRCRALFEWVAIDRAADWPVFVSLAEARAYCRWRGVRLPTEAELHRAMYGTPDGEPRSFPWGEESPEPGVHGNFGFHLWAPTPVGAFPAGGSAWGLLDTIGNGWEWTASVFAPFPGFDAYIPSYPGYSADFFDAHHFVMLGGSWATPTPLIRASFRNWFQDHYPYAFAGFRTVHGL